MLAGRDGKPVGVTVSDTGDQVVTTAAPRVVQLPPHGTAYVTINKYRCDLGVIDEFRMLRLTVPGQRKALSLTFPPGPPTSGYCGADDPGSTVHVSPIEPSFAATLHSR